MSKADQHDFKGLQDWIEVFRAGTHTDSKGRSCTFTRADLDEIVGNMAIGPAPAVLGHPKHNDPAYAWVREGGVKREGDALFAKFEDVNPDFEAGVDSGAYRERSVSIFKDKDAGWRLRHVGWLGAAPPAINGLTPLDYSASVDDYEFSSEDLDVGYALADTAELLRGLREQLIAKDGLEAADAALPNWRIQSIADAAQRIQAEAREEADGGPRPFSKPDNPGGVMSFTQAQLDAAAAQARKETEEKATKDFAAKEAELTKLRGERQAERIAQQIDGWKAKGLLTPAEEPGLAEFMAALEAQADELNFSAADKSEVKKAPAQFFADFMAARKPVVKLGAASGAAEEGEGAGPKVTEFSRQPGYAGVEVDPDRADTDKRIKEYMAKHGVNYATAAANIMAG
ncbi:MAG: hypothetical protein A2Z93_06195 [Curvibacter sp. GWA2_64_110]|nr:MAG: hypothetical protein A2Z93_06195 [Curvibacter sp. GWA2_64_110]HCY15610.1 hypothetical protein [Curvibacter sp.]